MPEQPISLYLHIPFCSVRCGYCDFNTYAGMQNLIPDYVNALEKEIAYMGQLAGEDPQVHTLYFGGGTPSLLSHADLEKILAAINRSFKIDSGAEITLEANPNNLDIDYLRGLCSLGINRLSIGVQSMHPADLLVLDRRHDPLQAIRSYNESRKAGFNNISLDLIFGIPGQSLKRWTDTLRIVREMAPQHLSLYSLTVEEGTPLYHDYSRGHLPVIDDDLSADMYELAMDLLADADYQQYEISNWARYDDCKNLLTSRHNLQYWRNLAYIGLGAGAHGSWKGFRMANTAGIAAYIQAMKEQQDLPFPASPAAVDTVSIDQLCEMQETMMVGLRLTLEGVAKQSFINRFGRPMEEVFGTIINNLIGDGLLEWAEWDHQICLRLTRRGRLLGNLVFREFV